MANAARDNNSEPTLLGTSSADGTTPIRVRVNPSTGAMQVNDAITGSNLSGNIAARDSNNIPVLMGVSSVDGVTPTPIYADATTGELLIDSS